jgi:hypothetical protein
MVRDLADCWASEENPWMTNKDPRKNPKINKDFTFIPFTL